MYLGIDIGGTKTLVAALDNNGVIIEKHKFKTSQNYSIFSKELKATIVKLKYKFKACGVGLPASLMNRKQKIENEFGNLNWHNISIENDLAKFLDCPIIVDNDAKIAALSEYMLVKENFSRVLYITVSTGIGYGLIVDGIIDEFIGDGGGKTLMLEHNEKLMPWEEFASGKAIVNRYGKKAKDIKDTQTWLQISRDLAIGIIHLISVTEPELIIIGGSVGNYFERFSEFLSEDLEKYNLPVIKMPKIIKAERPDDAVLYGCYDIAKQRYP